jgi:hypothetical protein
MEHLTTNLDGVLQVLLADGPLLALQGGLLLCGLLIIFLVAFVTRDILLRSDSLLAQLSAILITAVLPIVGFLLYLLFRPSSTVRERALEQKMDALFERMKDQKKHAHNKTQTASHASPSKELL